MSRYIYNDEDNAPMNDDFFAHVTGIEDMHGHNPTIYHTCSEMRASEKGLPFTDPEPDNGCWNCKEYDGDRCHKDWNNNDECYYVPDRDDKEPEDWCEYHDKDESIKPEEYFDGNV